jgi:hypothetical protein
MTLYRHTASVMCIEMKGDNLELLLSARQKVMGRDSIMTCEIKFLFILLPLDLRVFPSSYIRLKRLLCVSISVSITCSFFFL